ncbi:hypothetical protein IE53DRAFT_386750 [Violaceomyces palustris]|uniref:Uncharacterized protein n=1 Tax=Violaceomyces palustris TaxID=1673888 RepID=A0ACD0NYS9_9BASI|nr:hypothetical protein IE53DRAFT_386750 [Violaceomyces palustris]
MAETPNLRPPDIGKSRSQLHHDHNPPSHRGSVHSLHTIHSDQRVAPSSEANTTPYQEEDTAGHDLDLDQDKEAQSQSPPFLRHLTHSVERDAEEEEEEEDDGASISSRSDASEEAAGLVSRLSDEYDREERRAKYQERSTRSPAFLGRGNQKSPRFYEDDEDDLDGQDEFADESAFVGVNGGPLVGHHGGGGRGGANSARQGAGFVDRRETAGSSKRLKSRGTLSRFWEIAREALPTLILSLFSLVFSGELLVHLARWPVFVKVDKLFILVPILLNMKGNLEMNLSLRMSTSANIGELDIRRTRETLIKGNMALLQVQALIVSSFAGILAFVLGVLTPTNDASDRVPAKMIGEVGGGAVGDAGGQTDVLNRIARSAVSIVLTRLRRRRHVTGQEAGRIEARRIIHKHPKPPVDPALKLKNSYFEFVLVIATGMLSASLSSAILGSFMCALVVVARRMGGNPDNIASPLAASLGDLLTLTLMGLLASLLAHFEGTFLATIILAILVVACISFFIVTYRNAYVRELLTSGWVPLLVAMFISSGAGLVLDSFVLKYQGFALLAPVMTGLPGACAAIFASRISTALHSGQGSADLRRIAKAGQNGGAIGLLKSLKAILTTKPTEGFLVPATLLSIGVTIEVTFILLVWASGEMSFGWPFALTYSLVSLASVLFALFLSHVICLLLWSRDYDPDIYCLPYVSSTVDVVGQALLVLAFSTAILLGDSIHAAVNAGEGHGGV